MSKSGTRLWNGSRHLDGCSLVEATTKVGCECVFGALTPVSCTVIAWPMQRMTRHNGLAQVPNKRGKLCCRVAALFLTKNQLEIKICIKYFKFTEVA